MEGLVMKPSDKSLPITFKDLGAIPSPANIQTSVWQQPLKTAGTESQKRQTCPGLTKCSLQGRLMDLSMSRVAQGDPSVSQATQGDPSMSQATQDREIPKAGRESLLLSYTKTPNRRYLDFATYQLRDYPVVSVTQDRPCVLGTVDP